MKKIILTVLVAVSCGTLLANTNADMRIRFEKLPVAIPDRPSRDGWWEIFSQTIEEYAPTLFESRLHATRHIRWLMRFSGDSEAYRDATENAAISAFTTTLDYSAREAFLDAPLMLWLHEREDALSSFFKNSIGSVDEEEVLANDVSYQQSSERWWKRLEQNGVRYGIRPFQRNPYVYASYALGNARNPFAFVNTRYYLEGLNDHRAEVTASFRAMKRTTLDVGTSYSFGRDERSGFTLRFTRKTGRQGLIFAGVGLRQHNEFVAGFTTPL